MRTQSQQLRVVESGKKGFESLSIAKPVTHHPRSLHFSEYEIKSPVLRLGALFPCKESGLKNTEEQGVLALRQGGPQGKAGAGWPVPGPASKVDEGPCVPYGSPQHGRGGMSEGKGDAHVCLGY